MLTLLLTNTTPLLKAQNALKQDEEFNQLTAINRSNIEVGIMSGINGSVFQFGQPLRDAQTQVGIGQLTQGFIKWGGNTGSAFKTSPGYLQKSNRLRIPRPDSSFTLTYNMHSVSIPVQYVYQNNYTYLGGNLFQQFYFSGGLGVNFLAKADREVEVDNLDLSQSSPITDKVSSLELSFLFSIGSRFIVSKTGSVYIAVRGSNGLTSINENMDLFSNPGGQVGSIEITQVSLALMVGVSTSLVPAREEEAQKQQGPF